MYTVLGAVFVFFFKQKTAYEMRISNWSSDVCSSDLSSLRSHPRHAGLVPASNEPPAIAFGARWTPEQVRGDVARGTLNPAPPPPGLADRKSTRLNSSH